jgi:FkbM family methyltransferase
MPGSGVRVPHNPLIYSMPMSNILHMNLQTVVNKIRSSPIYTNSHLKQIKAIMLNLGQLNARIRPFKSFAQTGEDAILRHWLPEKKGFYLEVGSGKPIADSNTYFLYKRGWSGICVDPIFENSRLHKLFRRRDTHLQILVGEMAQIRNFWEFNSYGFSTANEEVANKLIEAKKVELLHKSQIKETPLSEIVPLITPVEPSLLSIDVEGFEMAVLKSNNWERFSPRLICIEEWELAVTAPSEIGIYLQGVGYIWKGWTGLTSFYVHNEYLTNIKTSLHYR